jgi:type IV pilus assembly protein PilB
MVTVVSPSSKPSDQLQKSTDLLEKLEEASVEEHVAREAVKNGLAYVDLALVSIDPSDALLLSEAEARSLGAGIFRFDQGLMLAGTTHPSDEVQSCLATLAEEKGAKLKLFLISEASFDKILEAYRKRILVERLDQMRVELHGSDLENFNQNFGELIELSRSGERMATTKAMEIILAGATKLGSSDIHIETSEEEARLRFRVDGELQDIGKLPLALYKLILSRIKLLAKMKLNVRDRAQDGHFEMHTDNERTDIRVSIIPAQFGENINMRLLHGADAFVDVQNLGMRKSVLEAVLHQAEKPNGLILNTGPTGSGKTTTLYGLLNHINDATKKIITVEDPIEYRLPGIVQTEVTEKESVSHQVAGGMVTGAESGYSFADALRAVVRQDPDVILVGEIRDGETASTAMNASLTGHLVFSTLHTNDAPASITRFRELGVSSSLMASAVNIFIAQRLVRTLCQKCKQNYEPAESTKKAFLEILSRIPKTVREPIPTEVTTLTRSVGCGECHFTGYQGRVAVYEVFAVGENMAKLLNQNPSEVAIRQLAKEEGMLTLIEDGVLKCLEGITTLAEVVRHTGTEESLEGFFETILASEKM